MSKKKTIVANWKMHPLTSKEALSLFKEISKNLRKIKDTTVIICPPAIHLPTFKKLGARSQILLGAQDAFYGSIGAFTGEISGDMLYEAGARYAILGHSERRAMGETNQEINKKIKGALAAGLRPILCVGENVRGENHEYFNEVKKDLEENLAGISKNFISKITVAYEPVWAISTTPGRRDATPEDAREMAIFIRKVLSDKFGKDALGAKILYGGSVNDRDARDFLEHGGVDGLLVGKASLDPKKFIKILQS